MCNHKKGFFGSAPIDTKLTKLLFVVENSEKIKRNVCIYQFHGRLQHFYFLIDQQCVSIVETEEYFHICSKSHELNT